MNGDGFLDITYFNTITDLITLKNINGNFSFNALNILGSGCIGDYTDNVLIDDMDNDGDLDIVAINGQRGGGFQTHSVCRNFNLLANNGIGNFISHIIINDIISGPLPFILSAHGSTSFDLNNNGYVDLVTPSLNIINNGDGLFSNGERLIPFCNSLNSDFNGDGYLDLVGTIPGAPLLSYLNDHSGTLIQFETSAGSYFGGNSSGDFDNDGDIDIAFGYYGGNTVGILLNGDIPLPVELSSFTSQTNANNVTIDWTTSSEVNNAGFDIERSMFNEEFIKTGSVAGNGNSNTSHNYSFTDKNLQSGKYKYRLKQIDFNGNYKYYGLSGEVIVGIPDKFYLSQNYPNPFNPSSNLGFGISKLGFVSLKVYDALGNEVAVIVNELKNAGSYNYQFSTVNFQLPSGIYFYSLYVDGEMIDTKRMVLLK